MKWKSCQGQKCSDLTFSRIFRWSQNVFLIGIVTYCVTVSVATGTTLEEIISNQELAIEYNPPFIDFITRLPFGP